VLAHPERYTGIGTAYGWIPRLRDAGVLMCANAGSFFGAHGQEAERVVRRMLAEGHVDLVASDHHARPERAPSLRQLHDRLEANRAVPRDTARRIAELLLAGNPSAIVEGRVPEVVPPAELDDGLAGRLRRLVRGERR
jgi:tyrosine-protein phosphatase YwqE